MAHVNEIIAAVLMLMGTMFFIAGTVGLLRFPDVYTRLHSLTKADNLGLGLIVAGLIVDADSTAEALELILIWLMVLLSSSTISYLVARAALHRGVKPWRSP